VGESVIWLFIAVPPQRVPEGRGEAGIDPPQLPPLEAAKVGGCRAVLFLWQQDRLGPFPGRLRMREGGSQTSSPTFVYFASPSVRAMGAACDARLLLIFCAQILDDLLCPNSG